MPLINKILHKNVLIKFGHKAPTKPHLSPRKHIEIHYGVKVQLTHKEDVSPKLYKAGILRVQSIVGAALFYGRAMDKKFW